MEEKQYILPPHPVACIPYKEEIVCPETPAAAEESLAELVRQAVDELRIELSAELETQVRRVRTELHDELQSEILKEMELDSDAKIKKP